MLLTSYILCSLFEQAIVSPVLEFSVKTESKENIKFTIKISDLLTKIEQFKIKPYIEFSHNNIKGIATLPKRFIIESDPYDVIYDCISVVDLGDKKINLTEFNFEQRKNLLQQLPSFFFT